MDQIEQVGTLRIIELECPAESDQHALGHAYYGAALQPPVVVDAYARQGRDFLSAQALDTPVAAGR